MIGRCAKGGRDRAGVSQEFLVIPGVAGDEAFGHPIGSHCSPFVMIPVAALSEPYLSQVFEAPIPGDIGGGGIGIGIKKRMWFGGHEKKPFFCWGGEQKNIREKRIFHWGEQTSGFTFP